MKSTSGKIIATVQWSGQTHRIVIFYYYSFLCFEAAELIRRSVQRDNYPSTVTVKTSKALKSVILKETFLMGLDQFLSE